MNIFLWKNYITLSQSNHRKTFVCLLHYRTRNIVVFKFHQHFDVRWKRRWLIGLPRKSEEVFCWVWVSVGDCWYLYVNILVEQTRRNLPLRQQWMILTEKCNKDDLQKSYSAILNMYSIYISAILVYVIN